MKQYQEWNHKEVEKFLSCIWYTTKQNFFVVVGSQFRKNEITGKMLENITKHYQLIDYGIGVVEAIRLMKEIKCLKKKRR